MLGWMIFRHSMGMVTRNLGSAIRIALIPALIGVFVMIAGAMMTGVSMETFVNEQAMQQMLTEQGLGAVFLPLLLIFLVVFVIEFWVFVSWHRFILLEEYPTGWVPTFRTDRILAYFGNVILLGLIAVGSGIALMLVVSIVGAAGGGLAAAVMFVFLIAIIVATYRLTPILPAAAIGKPLKVSEAWDATRGSSWAIVLVLVLIFIVQFLIQIVAGFSMMIFAPLGFVFLLLSMLVMTLLNVSVLTTLYGHYVEGRPLV